MDNLYSNLVLFVISKHSGSELLVLLTNTMVTDLKSENVIEVNMALVAAAYLVPPDMMPVIFPIVLQRTNHSKVRISPSTILILRHQNLPLRS